MPSDRPYCARANAERQIAEINAAAAALADSLRQQVQAFCRQHDADFDAIEAALDELVAEVRFDATGPAVRKFYAADHQIATIEETDLRRSAPVVL